MTADERRVLIGISSLLELMVNRPEPMDGRYFEQVPVMLDWRERVDATLDVMRPAAARLRKRQVRG